MKGDCARAIPAPLTLSLVEMMTFLRCTLVSLVVAAVLSGCTGLTTGSNIGSGGQDSPFTPMPRGDEIPDLVFLDADEAFQADDFVAAQRDFGTLFIVEPNYQGTLPVDALVATCQQLGVNCDLVFGRLELMREVFNGSFGPIDSWVPQQRQDYFAILQCYERAYAADHANAVAIAGHVVNSPDPYFAGAAARCTEHAEVALAEERRRREADEALLVWYDNEPCMNENRVALLDAFDVDDWESFVGIYPQYQLCADTLMTIIDRGVLAGDPRLGLAHDVAWSDMSEIDAIMEDYEYTYEEVRDAMIELDSDPEYNALVVRWGNLDFEEQRLLNQISSLEIAANALTGGNRAGVEQQINALEQQLVTLRREKRDVMGDINRLRRRLGLDSRETP